MVRSQLLVIFFGISPFCNGFPLAFSPSSLPCLIPSFLPYVDLAPVFVPSLLLPFITFPSEQALVIALQFSPSFLSPKTKRPNQVSLRQQCEAGAGLAYRTKRKQGWLAQRRKESRKRQTKGGRALLGQTRLCLTLLLSLVQPGGDDDARSAVGESLAETCGGQRPLAAIKLSRTSLAKLGARPANRPN